MSGTTLIAQISLSLRELQNVKYYLANPTDHMQSITGLVTLTHISLASFMWDIGKQCRTSSDATKDGV